MKNDPKLMFEKLNKLDYTLVEYKMSTLGYTPRIIKAMRKESLKYLSLKATKKGMYAPSFLVDEFWHQMILCTKFYETVTKTVGFFIHHSPNDGTKQMARINKEAYWKTMQIIYDTFGELNEEIWCIQKRSRKGVKE